MVEYFDFKDTTVKNANLRDTNDLVERLNNIQANTLKNYYGGWLFSKIIDKCYAYAGDEPVDNSIFVEIRGFAVTIQDDLEYANREYPPKLITPIDPALLETIDRLKALKLDVSFRVNSDDEYGAIMVVGW